MIQLGILDFLLDLALDWDNVPSYEYLVPDPEIHAYESDAHEILYVSPVIHHVRPSIENTVEDKATYKDIPLPIFRGGVTIGEAEERIERVTDFGGWAISESFGEDRYPDAFWNQ